LRRSLQVRGGRGSRASRPSVLLEEAFPRANWGRGLGVCQPSETERYGTPLQYSFRAPIGAYRVNLYFAEIWSGCFSVGCRVFNVQVQGTTVFSNLDVFAQAGANAALEKSTTASVTNGTLTIGFGSVTQSPIISAIEVVHQ
jgi:hypothetical protein